MNASSSLPTAGLPMMTDISTTANARFTSLALGWYLRLAEYNARLTTALIKPPSTLCILLRRLDVAIAPPASKKWRRCGQAKSNRLLENSANETGRLSWADSSMTNSLYLEYSSVQNLMGTLRHTIRRYATT